MSSRIQLSPVLVADLWDQLAGTKQMELDDYDQIRLDWRELAGNVQADVTARWQAAAPENITTIADIDWFRNEVRRLYGFAVPGVGYDHEVDNPVCARRQLPSLLELFDRLGRYAGWDQELHRHRDPYLSHANCPGFSGPKRSRLPRRTGQATRQR